MATTQALRLVSAGRPIPVGAALETGDAENARQRPCTRAQIAESYGEVCDPSRWHAGWVQTSSGDIVLLVTLSGGKYEEGTRVRRLSPESVEWVSQNSMAETGKRARILMDPERKVYLWERDTKKDPFICRGRVQYQQHVGNKPMYVTFDRIG